MRMELAVHPISEIRTGTRTALNGSRLEVNADELKQLLLEDSRLQGIDIELVRPGETARLGYVFDVVEPRAKEPGTGSDFPGILGPTARVGHGTTHVLRGAAVTVIAEGRDPPSRSARGINRVLEMAGPAAEASPYGALNHVVLLPHTRPEVEWHGAMNVLRMASVKAAAYLARAAITEAPASTEVYDLDGPWTEERKGLPRVAYIGQIHGHQHGTEVDEHILYGGNTLGIMPVLLHPNEWLDGAVCISYSWNSGVETYFYQNHPIILDSYRRHAAGEINFVGTIAVTAAALEEERARNCMLAAHLAKWNLRADGAIVTKYSFSGAPQADMHETARLCENLGIGTVILVGDLGLDGRAESAALMNIKEVDAVVMAGGRGVSWDVPAGERVIASDAAMAEAIGAPQELTANQVCGVANQQGASYVASVVY